MSEKIPECPTTPSSGHASQSSPYGCITPRSAKHSRAVSFEMGPSTPVGPQCESPKSYKRHQKQLLDHFPSESRAQTLFLPTPLTVGSGRKSKFHPGLCEPSTRSKSLTASLHALADEHTESRPRKLDLQVEDTLLRECDLQTDDSLNAEARETPEIEHALSPHDSTINYFSSDPLTPPTVANIPEPKTPSKFQRCSIDGFSDSEDDIQIVKVCDLDRIARKRLKNPFVGEAPDHEYRSPKKQELDLSTHMELLNHRTGERRVEKLSAEQQRFKPRKLDFTLDVKNPVKENYNIANKYIGNSIGKSFIMGEPQSKSSLSFNIFDDDADEA